MSKLLLTSILLGSLVFTSGRSIQTDQKSFKNNQRPIIVNKYFCGPAFTINNPSGYTVTKITVEHSGYSSYDINYPSFPYYIPQGPGGYFTFIVYFSGATATGSIRVSGATIGYVVCEQFDTRYLSPVPFYAGCDNYTVNITSDDECE